ncbi:hypothetical protein KA977_08090 [Candidatus Dependentiae bacterium]|nr:hypothetical protein [Candidatus Dependentiae bacterium]
MNHSSNLFLLFLLVPVISSTFIAIWFILYIQRKNRKSFQNTANNIGGSVIGLNEISGIFQNTDYTIKYIHRKKNTPPQCCITVKGKSSAFPITFLRESSIHNFVKRIKLSYEIQTNDPEFDNTVYIISRNNLFIQSVILSPDIKKNILTLFLNIKNLYKIEFNNLGAVLYLSPCEIDSLDKEFIEKSVSMLSHTLLQISMVPKIGLQTPISFDIIHYSVFSLYSIIGIILFIYALSYYKPLFHEPYFYGIIYGIIAFLILIFFTFFSVRGRSNSHIIFFICLITGLLGFIFTGIGATLTYNGYFDKSEEANHQVSITNKYTVRNKNSHSYYIEFKYWDSNQKIISYSVGSDFYYNVDINQKIIIVTRKGKLGFEWVKSILK